MIRALEDVRQVDAAVTGVLAAVHHWPVLNRFHEDVRPGRVPSDFDYPLSTGEAGADGKLRWPALLVWPGVALHAVSRRSKSLNYQPVRGRLSCHGFTVITGNTS